jgi:4-deoxy-L-threo-5-hexosulose-uronate ketol-isomerase
MTTTHIPATHPDDYQGLDTAGLRRRFLATGMFVPGQTRWTLCGDDRLLLGGVLPAGPTPLIGPDVLGGAAFLARRECGIMNLGERGTVTVDGAPFVLERGDTLYIGRGAGAVHLDGAQAAFYVASAPAHAAYPHRLIRAAEAQTKTLGSQATANVRTIQLAIAPGLVDACQLMMGITRLAPGSVWNTMPCHLHDRRMEAYLYCELPADQMVVHLMGRPEATRHLIVRDREAVIAPSWSIHCAAGTAAYAFVWTMVGENQEFADMRAVPTTGLL